MNRLIESSRVSLLSLCYMKLTSPREVSGIRLEYAIQWSNLEALKSYNYMIVPFRELLPPPLHQLRFSDPKIAFYVQAGGLA